MSLDEVTSAVDAAPARHERWKRRGSSGTFATFTDPAVTVIFDDAEGLSAVAVDGVRGPQVHVGPIPLVGGIPSETVDRFADYVRSRQAGTLCAGFDDGMWLPEWGLVIRAQRCNDILVTRPVFAAAEWAEWCGDPYEGRIPGIEWWAGWLP
ncbi:hypothetical protein [Actinoplanes sp. HUAS TT8]|uniref:hypothetical protein n=1 Tax=Actinoplanes sp. HUAS TT8 TaxID=3447453 RepID=UPI003F527004